ncbi:MAG: hypothetical protein ACOYNV_16105 [Propionivibrio sp.]
MPLLFFAAWHVMPAVLDSDGLRWLSGIVTILWALEFYFFQRLTAVSMVDGLSSKEHERLILRLASLRKRVWWVGGIGLSCALLIWLLASSGLPLSSPVYAAMAGILFGVSLSYLILIPGWIGESQHFVDRVKYRDSMAKKRDDAVKAMSERSSN